MSSNIVLDAGGDAVTGFSRKPILGRPFAERYAELVTGEGSHPVDAMISDIPSVAARRRRLLVLSKRIEKQVHNPAEFRNYEDRRAGQAAEREELFFDAGHAYGELEGRAESIDAAVEANPDASAFALKVRRGAIGSRLPRDRVVAVLLETARAFVLGLELPSPPARPMDEPRAR